MALSEKLQKALSGYRQLEEQGRQVRLSAEEQSRLELLRDLLEEAHVPLEPAAGAAWRRALGALRKKKEAPLTPRPVLPTVLVLLTDKRLVKALEGTLRLEVRTALPPGGRPSAIVVDLDHALLAKEQHSGAPLVLINAKWPEDLMGKFASLTPTAFVKRPASAATIVDAVERALTAPSNAFEPPYPR